MATNDMMCPRASCISVLIVTVLVSSASSARTFNVAPVQLDNGEPGMIFKISLDKLLVAPTGSVTISMEVWTAPDSRTGMMKEIEDLAEIIGPIQPFHTIDGAFSRPDPMRTARELFLRTVPRAQLSASPQASLFVPLCDELTHVTLANGINEIPTVDCIPPATSVYLRACFRDVASNEELECETVRIETPEAITFAPRDFAVVGNGSHSFTVVWSPPLTSIPVGIERNSLDHFELYVPLRFRFIGRSSKRVSLVIR